MGLQFSYVAEGHYKTIVIQKKFTISDVKDMQGNDLRH